MLLLLGKVLELLWHLLVFVVLFLLLLVLSGSDMCALSENRCGRLLMCHIVFEEANHEFIDSDLGLNGSRVSH